MTPEEKYEKYKVKVHEHKRLTRKIEQCQNEIEYLEKCIGMTVRVQVPNDKDSVDVEAIDCSPPRLISMSNALKLNVQTYLTTLQYERDQIWE